MTQTTHMNQVALAAAGARPCAGATRRCATYAFLTDAPLEGNASVVMSMSWQHAQFSKDITTKRPARHLGGRPT